MESKHTERPNKGSFAGESWDIGGAKHWWSYPAFHQLTLGNFEPACITDTGSYRLREVQLHLIHKAPSPRLTRLNRPHDRVLRLMEVLRRMFTGRRIAAPHMPADHAHPQMNPPASNLQTLLAPRRRRFYIANLTQMSALHLSHGLPPGMQLHTNPKRKSKSERTHKSILHPLRNPILLQLPVERSLPDTQQPSRHQLVPLQLPNRPQNRLPLHLRDRDDPAISSLRPRLSQSCLRRAIRTRNPLHPKVLQLRRQIAHMQHRPRRQRASPLDRILQLSHIARPVVLRHHPQHVVRKGMYDAGLPLHPLQKVHRQHRY